MKLHCVYRSTAFENAAPRPEFYSKDVSLASFLRSLDSCGEVLGDVVFLNDGPGMPTARLTTMERAGEVVSLPGLGNSGSYRYALTALATRSWSDDDLVYFSEDDYLYRQNALPELIAVASAVESASYFTLYDYPGYRPVARGADGPPDQRVQAQYLRRHEQQRWCVNSIDWRAVRSTTMSFGARVADFRRDWWIHLLGTGGRIPDDGFVWDATQAFPARAALPALFEALNRRNGRRKRVRSSVAALKDYRAARDRLLLAPCPGLATHLHLPYLAPDVDWGAEATRCGR